MQIPDILKNCLTGHWMSGMPGQVAEQVRLHHSELHDIAAGAQLKILKINDFIVELEAVLRVCIWPRVIPRRSMCDARPILPAQQAFDPRDQDGQVERIESLLRRKNWSRITHT